MASHTTTVTDFQYYIYLQVETVYLDMKVSASQVTSDAVKISWRHFGGEEKQYVDGVQVQYWLLDAQTGFPTSQVQFTIFFLIICLYAEIFYIEL